MRQRWRYLNLLVVAASFVSIHSIALQASDPIDAAVQRRIENSPVLPLEEERFQLHPPSPGWTVGPVSGVTAEGKGSIYVMQRGSNAAPILAFDGYGTPLRS